MTGFISHNFIYGYKTALIRNAALKHLALNSAELLKLARNSGVPVVHVIHDGGQGGLFDLSKTGGQIISELSPIEGEAVVKKTLPNAFAGTDLDNVLHRFADRDQLIIAGLMTHMCVASTASSAVDHGYFTTLIASTTTSRDLKGVKGETVPAQVVKAAALATMKDRFSLVLNSVGELQDG